MALQEDKERSELLRKVRRTCKTAYALLRVLCVTIILAWLLLFLLGLFRFILPRAFQWVDEFVVSAPLDSLIFGLMPAVFIGIAMLVLKNISKGETPFSRKQSRRIRLIAYFMFAQVLLELLFSTAISVLYPDGLVFLNYYRASSFSTPTTYLNIEMLISAIVCYCISLAFQYGALLQSDSDDIL
jgi:hypothetical protein